MSRADDHQIWQVTTEMPVKVISTGQLQVYRSQKIGTQSIQINAKENYRGALAIWMTLFLVNQKENRLRFVPGRQKGLVPDVWALITSFAIGDNGTNIFSPLNTVASYALCLRGLFKINFHPDVLVEAVLHGDETMVRHILKTNPDLTKKGTGIDFSGREFKGTALQAAIACGDFAPNENSTGLCELIVEELKRQYPDQWHQLLHDQTLELYIKSLLFYAEKQVNKIRNLVAKKDADEAIDDAELATAKQRHQTYLKALHNNDLATMINAHTNPNPDPDPTKPDILDAQKDHVFQMDPALIDAIAAASDEEIQAVLDDPTIDSPLSNLLKQFRSNFEKLSHEEMIFNPQHLLKIYNLYDVFYSRVERTDPNWKKRELFGRHLVGFVQRYLPANIAQIFANPGLYDTVEKNMKNSRVFDFKYGSSAIFPLSFHSNSGVGYKFASVSGAAVRCGWVACIVACSKLMSDKNKHAWKTYAASIRDSNKASVCNSVV